MEEPRYESWEATTIGTMAGPPPPPEPPRRRRRWVLPAVVAVLVAVAGAGLVVSRSGDPDGAAAPVDASLSQSDTSPPHSSTAELVAEVLPSIVNVRVTSLGFDPFGQAQESEGEGSGVILDAGGIIVTNNHVVAGAVEVEIVFNDGEHEPLIGTVIGTDPERDLAVIRVDAENLDPVEIGRSSDLALGDDVVALGFPLGLGGPTVTKGIVSGLGRTIQAAGPAGASQELAGLLQTDAAINPGNSGGALVNAAGQLVGINTAAASAGAAENVGFAIPLDEAFPIIEELINEPPERQAWLGVQVSTVGTPAEAAQLGLPIETRGAAILGVVPDGPAERAGLEAGDVIVRVGDQEVASGADLTRALSPLTPGDVVEVQVVAESGGRTVDVEVGNRPASLS